MMYVHIVAQFYPISLFNGSQECLPVQARNGTKTQFRTSKDLPTNVGSSVNELEQQAAKKQLKKWKMIADDFAHVIYEEF